MDNSNKLDESSKNEIIATLKSSLSDHFDYVRNTNSMGDALDKIIDEIIQFIKELESKTNSNESTAGVDPNVRQHILKMTDIMTDLKEPLKLQSKHLLKSYQEMVTQIDTGFSVICGVQLKLNENSWGVAHQSVEVNNPKQQVDKTQCFSDVENMYINKIQQLEKENRDLRKENDKREKGLRRCCSELKRFGSKFVPQVPISYSIQLFYRRKGGMIGTVEKELKSFLKGYLHPVEFVRCEQVEDINPKKVLLVLCINASRLGSEAANAIEGIKRSEKTALIIFHYIDTHALTRLETTPSRKSLTSQKFKELGGIFDLAFQSDTGIYECKLNDNTITEIVSFIQTQAGK